MMNVLIPFDNFYYDFLINARTDGDPFRKNPVIVLLLRPYL